MADVAESALKNLEEAIRLGRTDVIVATLDIATQHMETDDLSGQIINRRLGESQDTCLHLAVKQGRMDAVRALLRAGAMPNIRNKDGLTPYELIGDDALRTPFTAHLLDAFSSGNWPLVEVILQGGVSVNACDGTPERNSLLHWAASIGNVTSVKFFLSRGANVNGTNRDGVTPLHEAVKRWNVGIIEALLDSGADPFIRATSGKFANLSPMAITPPGKSLEQMSSFPSTKLPASLAPPPLSPATSHHSMSDEQTSSPPMDGIQEENNPLRLLWPPPTLVRQLDGDWFHLEDTLQVAFHSTDSDVGFDKAAEVWTMILPNFEEHQLMLTIKVLPPDGALPMSCLVFSINSSLFARPESYNMLISAERINIQAADLAGMWYGLQTLLQIIRLNGKQRKLPPVSIKDHPDLRYRGFMLDLTQGRHPTMETLKELVQILAAFKMNMLQLRMSVSTFAYKGYESLWESTDAYTSSDMLELSEFAHKHFVSLVPHHDSFLNMKNILHAARAQTSGSDGGNVDVRNAVPLLRDLHRQLFACFPHSKFAHVGLDRPLETLHPDLRQPGEDYTDHMWRLHSSCSLHRRSMQLWASELQVRRSLLRCLPPSVIVMQLLHRTSEQQNATFCQPLVDAGANFFVCPDTLAAESVGGRPQSCFAQLVASSRSAVRFGAIGLLLTDWAELGHIHPFVTTLAPIVAAAATAWRASLALVDLEHLVPEVINRFLLFDDSNVAGLLLLDLSRIHGLLLRPSAIPLGRTSTPSSSAPSTPVHSRQLTDLSWWTPLVNNMALRPENYVIPVLTIEAVQLAMREVRHCQGVLASLQLCCVQRAAIMSELSFILEFFMYACRASRALVAVGGTGGTVAAGFGKLSLIARTDLANRLITVTHLFQEAWLCRHRKGALDASSALFSRALSVMHCEM